MKKRQRYLISILIIFTIFIITTALLNPLFNKEKETVNPQPTPEIVENFNDGYKAVWLSYLEYQNMDMSTKESFTTEIDKVFNNCKNTGINTVIAHVRPFGDALYKSDLFPTSHLITGTQGDIMPYDPLEIMIDIAKQYDMNIEAWVNPYRVKLNSKVPEVLSANNAGNNQDLTFEVDGGVFYNPALPQVRQLVIDGVLEIVNNYDVDGIHFDDYFYPTTDEDIDVQDYMLYSGDLSLADWRRENVNTLVRDVYSAIKQADSDMIFGISPQGNNDNNFSFQYSDVNLWLSTAGYVDYIMPQLYWGFDYLTKSEDTRFQYKNLVNEWASYPRDENVKLYLGLGAFRIGNGDGGNNSQDEWVSGENLGKMIQVVNEDNRVSGYALYRYDNLFKPSSEFNQITLDEVSNIILANK